MSNLVRFVNHKGVKERSLLKSVSITETQHTFIKEEKLNLSAIVRDVIDGLIELKKTTNEELKEFKLKRGI